MNLLRFGFAVAVLLPSSAAAMEALFEVTRHAFCPEVQNLEPVRAYGDATVLARQEPLHFWFEIKVSRAGYKYLQKFGRLPVQLAWGHNSLVVTRPRDVGITPEKWEEHKQTIGWKVRESPDGSFTWRTYAVRPLPNPPGAYYVSVIDPNRRKVAFQGLNNFPQLMIIQG